MDFPLLAGPTPPAGRIANIREPELPEPLFCDMVKYVVLRCVFRVFSLFGGIKSAPVEISKMSGAPLGFFFRPSRILDPKMSLNPLKKGVG